MDQPDSSLKSAPDGSLRSSAQQAAFQRDIEAIRRSLLPQTENDRSIALSQIRGGARVPQFI